MNATEYLGELSYWGFFWLLQIILMELWPDGEEQLVSGALFWTLWQTK